MKKIILLSIALFVGIQIFAQTDIERCGTSAYYEFLENEYPDIKKSLAAQYQQTLDAIHQSSFKSTGVVHTIPVVVHIVYENEDENISDAQVQSQLDVLNIDFRKMNEDVSMVPAMFADLVGDAEIEFCLATLDPNGNPTTGITRTQTNVNEFGNNNAIKSDADGKSPWQTNRYLNIWVGDLIDGLLGYATKPNSPASTDGIVIDYDNFGTVGTADFPFNRGRTTTHEVGHYLGLEHIWGDGDCSVDDGISDTPLQEAEYIGCPTSGSSCGSADMYMNYMDYVNDACMFMFTHEQAQVMRFNLENARASLLESTPIACDPTQGEGCKNLTINSIQMSFEDSEDFDRWKIINTNNDSKEWIISEGIGQESGARTGSKCMAYTWSSSMNADDWFFTPCIQVKGNKAYKLRFWYATASDSDYIEKMKVGFASSASPDAILGNPIDFGAVSQPYNTNLSNNNYKEIVLGMPNFGDTEIHVGFQCYSDVEQHSLLIDDINIEMLVGTQDAIPSEAVDMYPNPVKDHLTVDLDFDKNIEHLSVSLVDITGRILNQKSFENYSKGKLQFDLNDYPNGVYFINIKADRVYKVYRVISL